MEAAVEVLRGAVGNGRYEGDEVGSAAVDVLATGGGHGDVEPRAEEEGGGRWAEGTKRGSGGA